MSPAQKFVTKALMGLKVKTGIKGGRLATNHSRAGLKVRSAVKGGRLASNHTRAALALR